MTDQSECIPSPPPLPPHLITGTLTAPKRRMTFGMLALILSLIGITIVPTGLGLAALILGAIGLFRSEKRRWIAITAIIISSVDIVGGYYFLFYWQPPQPRDDDVDIKRWINEENSVDHLVQISMRPSASNSSLGVLEIRNPSVVPVDIHVDIKNLDNQQSASFDSKIDAGSTHEISNRTDGWNFRPNEEIVISTPHQSQHHEPSQWMTTRMDDGEVGIKKENSQ
jgi:hypothetical protein